MYLNFSHVAKNNSVKQYHFNVYIKDVDGEETILSFYTYKDFSGYSIDHGVRKAEYLILIGTAILGNQEYIKNMISSHE